MPSASCRSQSALAADGSRSTVGSAVRTSTSRSMPRSRSRCGGHRPDAPQRVDRQLLQKRLDALGRDHRQAVRLLPARRDLREELVRRDAGRRRQSRLLADRRLQPLRDVMPSGSPQAFSVTSRYASSSDSGSTSGVTARKIANTACEAARYLLEVRPDDDELRAEPHGARHRHRRAHAERARLVARRRDDAALVGVAADGDRLAAQRRVVALLDGRVEGVHVDVEDAPHAAVVPLRKSGRPLSGQDRTHETRTHRRSKDTTA